MIYFLVYPDYVRLTKYFSFKQRLEDLIANGSEGYPIIVDWYSTDEAVERIKHGFKKLLEKHTLSDFHDDLLFLTLAKVQEIEAISYHYDYEAVQINRTKELARLLLTFNKSRSKSTNSLLLKSINETVKVKDQKVLSLIMDSIINSIASGQHTALDYNYNISNWISIDKGFNSPKLNLKAIEDAADQTPIDSKKLYKTQMANLCLYLYPYLNRETHLKTNDGVKLSHPQLDFYFDLLVLFDFIDPDTIESDNLDYVSSLLRNQLNKLKP